MKVTNKDISHFYIANVPQNVDVQLVLLLLADSAIKKLVAESKLNE